MMKGLRTTGSTFFSFFSFFSFGVTPDLVRLTSAMMIKSCAMSEKARVECVAERKEIWTTGKRPASRSADQNRAASCHRLSSCPHLSTHHVR